MKIGILVESFPRISQTWLDNQLIDLLERGHDVVIYSVYSTRDPIIHQQVKTYGLQKRTQYFYYPKSKSVKSILGGLKYASKYFGNTGFFKIFLAVKAVFEKKVEPLFAFNYAFLKDIERLDILHSHFGEMGVFAAKMKKAGLLGKTKIVVSFHGHDIFPYKREVYRKEYRIFEDYADALLVNSEYSKNLLNEIIHFNKLKIIPVGLNCQYFSPNEKIKSDHFKILFVGRLVHWKGPEIAVDIFKKLKKKNKKIRLNFIGDGDLRETLQDKIEKLNIGDSVKMLGALSQEEIVDHFNTSDIFLYPATYETSTGASDTQGLVIQEAQAMELPVVCSDIGGIKYGILDGETGFLVEEGNVDEFVEKIQLLIDQPELRLKMGKAGREYVKKYFDSKVIGDQLMLVYTEILNG